MQGMASGAEPAQLHHFGEQSARLGTDLLGEASHLRGALEHFSSRCSEGQFRVSVDGLDSALRSHASHADGLGRWVGEIGQRFEAADSALLAGRMPEVYSSSVIGTVEKPEHLKKAPADPIIQWLLDQWDKYLHPDKTEIPDVDEGEEWPLPEPAEDEPFLDKVKTFFIKLFQNDETGRTPEVNTMVPAGPAPVPLGQVNGIAVTMGTSGVLFGWMHKLIDDFNAWIDRFRPVQVPQEPEWPAPEPPKAPVFVVTSKDGINLRSEPGLSSTPGAVLSHLGQGIQYAEVDGERVIKDGHTWVKVRTENGTEGWIAEDIGTESIPEQAPDPGYTGIASQVPETSKTTDLYPRSDGHSTSNCTWYVAEALKKASGGKLDIGNSKKYVSLGNAGEWAAKAKAALADVNHKLHDAISAVDKSPAIGSVYNKDGHVMFVESVVQIKKNGKSIWRVNVSEESWAGQAFRTGKKVELNQAQRWTRTIDIPCDDQGQIAGGYGDFIHFNL